MRIKQICIITLAAVMPMLAITNTASGAICPAAKCGTDDETEPINTVTCATYSDSCYNGYRIRSCKTCRSGMSISSTTTSVTGCINTVDYNDCVFDGGTEITDCTGSCKIGTTYTTVSSGTNCATSTTECYGTQKLKSCVTCSTGYTLTTKSKITSSCGTVSYKTCVQDSSTCDGTCTNCFNSDMWIISRTETGVESKTTNVCNTSTCKCLSSTEYRCSKGYYGTATALLNNCVECPGSGTSVAGDNTSITNCYATSGKDGTGEYDFDPACYYSE